MEEARRQRAAAAVDDIDLDLLLLDLFRVVVDRDGVDVRTRFLDRLLPEAARFHIELVGAFGRDVLGNLLDQVADHEHVVAFQ